MLTMASSASANQDERAADPYDPLPGQRLVGDPDLLQMKALADAFWDERGVGLNPSYCPAAHKVYVADVPRDAPATFRYCYIALDEDHTGAALWAMHHSRRSRQTRRERAAKLCSYVIHEEGHGRGLALDPHAPRGVMAAVPEIPWDCQVLARELVPR